MERAKALAGEKAGEWVKAAQPKLTYEACKVWKLYCPTCYQPVHLRKSKKIKSYFAHYDFENKSCPERTHHSYKAGSTESLESHDQDLEEIETFIEYIFFGINPSYFQSLTPKELTDNSDFLECSIDWLIANIEFSIRKWVKHYCQNYGFLNWNNSEREVNYLMDCLHILVEREGILKRVITYSIFVYKNSKALSDNLMLKFGLTGLSISKEIFVSLITVDLVVIRLSQVANEEGKADIINVPTISEFVNIKIPKNTKPIRLKKQSLIKLISNNFFSNLPVLVGAHKTRGINYYVCFREGFENKFWFYAIKDDSNLQGKATIDGQNLRGKTNSKIVSVYGKASRASLYRKEEDKQKRNNKRVFSYLPEEALELYIDDSMDLCVRGHIERKLEKVMLKGIQKIVYHKVGYSMFALLGSGFISSEIAEKAAQLTLEAEYPDLDGPQALQKFRELLF